jgi:4-amino-4-deoxy-L-arabinose transferase-like glycosyltransferase
LSPAVTPEDRVWRARYFVVVAGFTVLHIVLAAVFPVAGDEAYYWDCSRNPSWSYFDQPPLVIWTMVPARIVLGETALAVRSPVVFASLLLALFLLPLIRRLGGGPREATWAYLLLHAMPIYFLGNFYESTDTGMITAYVAATWAAVAIAQGSRRAWWGFGVACGLGFLAKFPAVLAVFSLIPALMQREVRRQLLTARPYLAALLSFALTAPVWIWGAQHDWDNIVFQLRGRHQRAPTEGLEHLVGFVATNLAGATPFLLIAMMIAWWYSRRQKDPGWAVFRVAVATPFAFFGLISIWKHVGGHWGAPGLVLGIVPIALVAFPGRRIWVALGTVMGLALSAVLTFAALDPEAVLAAYRNARPEARTPKGIVAMIGNQEIAEEIQRRLRPGEVMASESYTLVHLLPLLVGGELPSTLAHLGGMHGFASLYWHPPERWDGIDVLFVTERTGNDDKLAELFEACSEEEPIRVFRGGELARELRTLRCRDLLRPEPAFSRLPRGASP